MLLFVAFVVHEKCKSVEDWWNDFDGGKEKILENKARPKAFRPIYVTHELTRYRMQAFLMRGQRLTA